MRSIRTLVLLASCVLVCVAEARPSARHRQFLTFLDQVDSAQLELQNGRGDAFKALWSRADDITLAGGFGGKVERGWPAISARLDWVAGQFSNGWHRQERLVTNVSGDLGYVVQLEHIESVRPGKLRIRSATIA